MKFVLLLIIKIYWKLIPPNNRKNCIYRVSCSNYVFQETKLNGFLKGIVAFKYRYHNCRQGFEIFENPIDRTKQIILPNGGILNENEIAERLL